MKKQIERNKKKTKIALKTHFLWQTSYYTFQSRVDMKSSNSYEYVIITFQNTFCSWSFAKHSMPFLLMHLKAFLAFSAKEKLRKKYFVRKV